MTQAAGGHVFDQIRAVNDVVIAEMLDPQDKTPGGIVIPDTAKKAPIWFKVIAVGPKVDGVKVGERILFVAVQGRVEHEGRTIVALKPENLLGVLPAPKESRIHQDPTRF